MKNITLLLAFILTLSINGQKTDSTIRLKLDFYIDDEIQDLNEIYIRIEQIQSNDIFSSLEIGNQRHFLNVEPTENLLLRKTKDSIEIKKIDGQYRILTSFNTHSEDKVETFIPLKNNGHVVVGVIKDYKSFREKVYKKHQLHKIYSKEKFDLENQYPFLVISEYLPDNEKPSVFYVTSIYSDSEEKPFWGFSVNSFKSM